MKDLNNINKAAKNTRFIFLISLILPVFMGWVCWALSTGATQSTVLRENYLSLSAIFISFCALVAIPVSFIFRWDWRASNYGASLFGIASVSCLGVYPFLCIVIYSKLPILIRGILLCIELTVIFFWCARFVRIYSSIFQDPELFGKIYVEEDDAVYFLQQGDKQVLDLKLKFSQFPPGKFFAITMVAGVALFLFSSEIVSVIGVPFTQIFLAVSMAPVPAAFFGVATKMWLIFFKYPAQIKARSGKMTYVDMVSKPV